VNLTFEGCRIDVFEAAYENTSLKSVIQNLEEEICNDNLISLKSLQSFMSTCKWEETEGGAEYHRNSQIPYTQSDWQFWSWFPRSRAGYRITIKAIHFESFRRTEIVRGIWSHI